MIAIVIAVALLGVLGIVGYYWYEGTHYVSTEDARVAADTVTVTPEDTPASSWNGRSGKGIRSRPAMCSASTDLGSALTYGITLWGRWIPRA